MMTIWDILFGVGGFIGLVGLFFPEFAWEMIYLGKRKFTEKDATKARIYSVILILFAILLYVLDMLYDRYFL
jgi:dihydrodipicolinate synthase/N-acetylneuraminate lyase